MNPWILYPIFFFVLPNIYYVAQDLSFFKGVTIFMNVCWILAPLCLFNLSPRRYFIYLLPLTFIPVFEITHIHQIGTYMTLGGVSAFYETDFNEALEYFTDALPKVGFVLVLWATYIWITLKKVPKIQLPVRLRYVAVGLAVFLLTLQTAKYIWREQRDLTESIVNFPLRQLATLQPLNFITKSTEFFQEKQSVKKFLKQKENYKFQAKAMTPRPEKEVFVLVIGESSRRESWQLYGYKRATTPRLNAETNIIAFDDIVSGANRTTLSLMTSLTKASPENLQLFYQSKSIMSLAREAGFKTYWFSNQAKYGLHDTNVNVIAQEADFVKFTNGDIDKASYDEKLLPLLDGALSESADKKFIVIHTLGSHKRYDYRYPHRFSKFRPSERTLATSESNQIDFYDNSILYTDYILSETISRLKKSSSMTSLMYFSDHGESIYDGSLRRLGHGFPKPHSAELKVPFFVWYSDEYKKTWPDKITEITAVRRNPASLVDLLDTIADFNKIDFERQEFNSFFKGDYKRSPRKFIDVQNEVLIYEE